MAFVMGSAARAVKVDDRTFDRLVFVEKDPKRCSELRRLRDQHLGRHIDIVEDDANIFLRNLARSEFGNSRGVLFADPFGAELAWVTVKHVAGLERLDMWLLFPVGAIGRMLPVIPQSGRCRAQLGEEIEHCVRGRTVAEALFARSSAKPLW